MPDAAPSPPDSADSRDHRLYLPHPEQWTVKVKRSAEKLYCYNRRPGEEFFHMILTGEIFVQSGEEKLCLNCALALGAITTNRLFWQRRESFGS